VKLLALWRYLGFEFLVNAFPRFRRFWEHYLCFVVRGKVIEWRLIKEDAVSLDSKRLAPAQGIAAAR
jgi:hypothetical protein